MEKLQSKHIKVVSALKTTYTNSLLVKIPWNDRLVGITGARGVGKTTLILQYIALNYQTNTEALYVNLDDIALSYNSLTTLADDFVKRGGKHLFLDEIHKFPNWSKELKTIYDTFFELKVVFTGSSILDIYKGQTDLSRRALVFNMNGLSFREFLQIETNQQFSSYTLPQLLSNHKDIAISIYQKTKPFQHFSNYLTYGYYPFYLQNKEFYSMRLSNTLVQIIENDMPILLNLDVQYINKLKRFVSILANDIPFKPNISTLAAALGVSWQLIIQYLNYLNKAKIIEIIYPAGKSISTLSKPEKIYLHHPNLFYVFKDEVQNKGNLRETFFVNQLAYKHKIEIPTRGDFLIDSKYTFEVGGKNKNFHQIADIADSYIVADDIEFGFENKIPLWLFGFLY